MSADCPVRYIITINALKEGWDCPFAYILASLADKSSAVDVEQIVGRVLRLPYARRNQNDVLNLSYVLTASSKFQETLDNVVRGLNHAGFSDRDFRATDAADPTTPKEPTIVNPTSLFPETPTVATIEEDDIDTTQITFTPITTTEQPAEIAETPTTPIVPVSVTNILEDAQQQASEMEEQIKNQEDENFMVTPEIAPQVKTATIQAVFAESAKQVQLPMFYVAAPTENTLFGAIEDMKLEKQHLLQSFRLAAQDTDISFAAAETNMYAVDIDAQSDEHTPRYEKVKGVTYDFILNYIRQAETLEARVKRCAKIVADEMGKMIPLSHKDIQEYVGRIFANFTETQLEDFMAHLAEYTQIIKKKILQLEDAHIEKEFRKLLDTDQILLKSSYAIPNKITLSTPSQGITKMLHTKEESVNGFEAAVINDVANLDNIEWWTRNIEKRGFYINGFINHYPDFIIKTKKGKIVLLETKGDHLDAEPKIRLGNIWANKAGNNYRYFLVYKDRQVDGAYTKNDFLEIIKNL